MSNPNPNIIVASLLLPSYQVLPLYFRHNNITSFFRQLNLYNFQRSVKGADVGSYQHDLFLRDRPELIKLMKRTKTKGTLSPRCDGSMSRNSPFGSRSPSVGHSSSMTPPGVAGQAFVQMYHHQQQQMNMTLPSKPLVVNSGGMNPNYVMSSSSDPAVVEKRLEQIDTVVNMVGGGGFGVGSRAINVNVNNPVSASAGADIKAEGAVNVNNANNANGGVEALAPPQQIAAPVPMAQQPKSVPMEIQTMAAMVVAGQPSPPMVPPTMLNRHTAV